MMHICTIQTDHVSPLEATHTHISQFSRGARGLETTEDGLLFLRRALLLFFFHRHQCQHRTTELHETTVDSSVNMLIWKKIYICKYTYKTIQSVPSRHLCARTYSCTRKRRCPMFPLMCHLLKLLQVLTSAASPMMHLPP